MMFMIMIVFSWMKRQKIIKKEKQSVRNIKLIFIYGRILKYLMRAKNKQRKNLIKNISSDSKNFNYSRMFSIVHVDQCRSCCVKILMKIKMIRILWKVLANCSSHQNSSIRINIDLSNRAFWCFMKLWFRNTNSIWNPASIFIN
jgi:hypothetical protein